MTQIQTLRLIIAFLLTVVVMLYFYTNRERDYYSKSAEPAVAEILTQISSWNKNIFLHYLSPETKKTLSGEQLENLMQLYHSWGRFHSIKELNFSRTVSAFSLIGEKRINYSGAVHFDGGDVSLNITLIERGGFFLIYNLAMTKIS